MIILDSFTQKPIKNAKIKLYPTLEVTCSENTYDPLRIGKTNTKG